MNKFPSIVFILALAAGCATTAPVTAPDALAVPALDDGLVDYMEWSANSTEVSEGLARLEELAIFDVGSLLVDAPAASGNCYGPCQDDPVDQVWMAEHARQTARFSALVAAVEDAAGAEPAPAGVDEAVTALNALSIVEVTGIHNAGNCYGPCPGDEERAGVAAAAASAVAGL